MGDVHKGDKKLSSEKKEKFWLEKVFQLLIK